MMNINHTKIERFYDYLDEATNLIFERTKLNYFDCVLYAADYLLVNEERLNQLDESIIAGLDKLYNNIKDDSFNREEIRKALQLILLKTFKHLQISFSEVTPDTMGMLIAYIVDLFYSDRDSISVLDANCGCGNLLFSMINNSIKGFNKIYGVDIETNYLNFALRMADLLEYEVEFFNQNNLQPMLVNPVDLIISDLPTGNEEVNFPTDLATVKNNITYKPFLIIENLIRYGKEGSYFIYLIPNEFFNQTHSEIMKNIILDSCYIQAIIELPIDMFTDVKNQKSILILQKKGTNIRVNKEILMLRFPSFKDTGKVKNALDKLQLWYKHNSRL